MKNQIAVLVLAVGLFQLVNCKCSTGFELDCLYDFFGKDSSEESSSKGDDSLSSALSKLTTTLQSSHHSHGHPHASDSLSTDALANLNQIPSIVSHLNKLTNAVMGVHKKISKNQHSKKDSKSSDEQNSEHSSDSSISKEDEHSTGKKSSSVKNDVNTLKEENTHMLKEMTKLTGMVKELTKRLESAEKNVVKPSDDTSTDPPPNNKETGKSVPKKD